MSNKLRGPALCNCKRSTLCPQPFNKPVFCGKDDLFPAEASSILVTRSRTPEASPYQVQRPRVEPRPPTLPSAFFVGDTFFFGPHSIPAQSRGNIYIIRQKGKNLTATISFCLQNTRNKKIISVFIRNISRWKVEEEESEVE